MWRLPSLEREIIGISFSPTSLICSWIKPSRTQSPYTLKAYRQTPLTLGTISRAGIFNQTLLAKHIRFFVQSHKLEGSYVVFAPDRTGLVHDFVHSPTTTPTRHQIHVPCIEKTAWNTYYLYPEDDNQSIFYVCGLPRTLLTQYILLAAQSNLNLIALTPPLLAYVQFYRLVYGKAFRRTQLAHDMRMHKNSLEHFFTYDSLARLLHIPTTFVQPREHCVSLVTALGLFSLGYAQE